MYPNPQEALPLPPRPNLEQYRKLAKDLVKACRSADPTATAAWAHRWVETLATVEPERNLLGTPADITASAGRIEEFARKQFAKTSGASEGALTSAQFVVARAHGFLSWPKFVTHLESLARENSSVSAYEAAASAIVTGDAATVSRLLREHPDLVRTRSTREHRATLLHYVSANGVEGYRQISPTNIATIAEMLLDAGAAVDAEAEVYGGGWTALGLVATSSPPSSAGVQRDVIDVLLRHGARMVGGRNHALVHACLANGQPDAAAYLAQQGAPLDLPSGAGLGRLDVVEQFFAGGVKPPDGQIADAFGMACGYGRAQVVEYFLDHGVDVNAEHHFHGSGHTALHVAAFHGHEDVVALLLQRGARVDVIDKTWGTAPLTWALTGWSRPSVNRDDRYYAVVARLVSAGAQATPEMLTWDKARGDPRMMAALSGRYPSAPESHDFPDD